MDIVVQKEKERLKIEPGNLKQESPLNDVFS